MTKEAKILQSLGFKVIKLNKEQIAKKKEWNRAYQVKADELSKIYPNGRKGMHAECCAYADSLVPLGY